MRKRHKEKRKKQARESKNNNPYKNPDNMSGFFCLLVFIENIIAIWQ